MDIPSLVRQQMGWLKRSCQSRQQHAASLPGPSKRAEPFQEHTSASAAHQYTQALRGLLKDASSTHRLHRVACIRIVRALLADVLASILFTALGYTVAEADQVVEEHIAPALMTYLVRHGPRLVRAHRHEPLG